MTHQRTNKKINSNELEIHRNSGPDEIPAQG